MEPGENNREQAAKRAPRLLLALIESAIQFGKKELGNDAEYDVAKADRFEVAQSTMVECLNEVSMQATAFVASMLAIPSTIEQAIQRLHAAQSYAHQKNEYYTLILDRWIKADSRSSRVRSRCVEALMTPADQGGRGLPYTRANAEASTHPDYAEFKDQMAGLSAEKGYAERAADEAVQQVHNCRAILQACVTASQLRIINGRAGKGEDKTS